MRKLPESELDIMLVIWELFPNNPEGICADTIISRLDKEWNKTTVLNFLIRLTNRGFVSCKKCGRTNLYSPIVAKDEYLKEESESFLQKMHHNSLTSLVASLYDGKCISKSDLEELKRFIEEAE